LRRRRDDGDAQAPRPAKAFPMRITVQLAPELIEAPEVARLADELGISLQAMHPGTSDPALASYFVVDVADAGAAQDIVSRLRHSPAVRAAYVKPHDAPA
jgi:pyruvate/2-oxoglutarate dehydrogenase complex dihydrolipoamide acyltransferase (E2) component